MRKVILVVCCIVFGVLTATAHSVTNTKDISSNSDVSKAKPVKAKAKSSVSASQTAAIQSPSSIVQTASPVIVANNYGWKEYWQDYSLGVPGIAFGSPTGYGANWGDIFVGGALASRSSSTNSAADGSLVAGFGIGDADKYVGLETAIAIISMNINDGDFGDDGNVAFKLHRNLPHNFAIALGAQNLGRWGNAHNEKETFYASGTKVFILRPDSANNMPLFVTVGVGNGVYRRQANQSVRVSNDHYGAFGSIAWHFVPRSGLVADYSAEKLNLGASIAPFNQLPVTMTVGALDVTGRNSKRIAWVGTLGVAVNFKNM